MPFTQAEAEEIREDFEDLIDTEFKWEGSSVFLVLDLLIAPFSGDEKDKFIDTYTNARRTGQPQNACTSEECDVLIVVCDDDQEENMSFIDITTFVTEKGINYNFPG
jgi:hypothetical protein